MKTYTIRGRYSFSGPGSAEELLFNYESNELTKGWIVRSAEMWIGGRTRAGSDPGGADPNFGAIKMKLQTDTIGANEFLEAEDNRNFAWNMMTYGISSSSPYNFVPQERFCIIDPDHIITRQLWATFTSEGWPGNESAPIDIDYLIVLEQVKTTPAENILQQVKSVAQDALN